MFGAICLFFFQAEDGIRDLTVTGVQTCALPISHECVPMQGSGTFSVEAAIGTLVPRTGHVLVPQNGAYCQRIARICRVLGRKLTTIDYPEDTQVAAADVDRALASDPSITNLALVHCEPTTGI